MIDIDVYSADNAPPKCKGRFYKGKVARFFNSKGEYVVSKRLIPMKRVSCKGCDQCMQDDEILNEHPEMLEDFEPHIEHNAVYERYVLAEYSHYETADDHGYELDSAELFFKWYSKYDWVTS